MEKIYWLVEQKKKQKEIAEPVFDELANLELPNRVLMKR